MASGFQGPGYFDANGNWIDGVPGQTINTPNSSTGEPAYKDPGATFTPDEFATPQGGQVATRPITTPNSSSGAPASGIRNLPATIEGATPGAETAESWLAKMRGVGGRIGAGMTGAGVFVAPAMQGPNAFGGDTQTQMKNAKASDDADRAQMQEFWRHPFGYTNPLASQAAPSPQPVTQGGPGRSPSGPVPPTGAPPPPVTIPPFNVPPPPPRALAPIPNFPIGGPTPGPTAGKVNPASVNLGQGVPPTAAAPQAPSPWFTTIDRPNADINAGPTVPGRLANPHGFGPNDFGALDLSGLFNHPQVAAAAAAHPAVQGALAQAQGGDWAGTPNMNDAALGNRIIGDGWGSGGRSGARAPVMQRTDDPNGLVGYGRVGKRQLNRVGVQDVMGP